MSKHVPVDECLCEVLNYAARYAIGRRTYAVQHVVSYIEPLVGELDDVTLRCIRNDIDEAAARDGGLGDERIDAPEWLRLRDKIGMELEKRRGDAQR